MTNVIYEVTIDDRHSGPYTYLYAGKEAAIARARMAVNLAQSHYHVAIPKTITESGRIFWAHLEDCITVKVEEKRLCDAGITE